MRVLKVSLLGLLGLVLLLVLLFWLSAWLALDHERSHAQATEALSLFSGEQRGLVRIPANGYEFRARVAGFTASSADQPADQGRNLILLHGFPETSVMWQPLIERASQAGYRVVAFDQRGYSPGARPTELADYEVPHLVGRRLGGRRRRRLRALPPRGS